MGRLNHFFLSCLGKLVAKMEPDCNEFQNKLEFSEEKPSIVYIHFSKLANLQNAQ